MSIVYIETSVISYLRSDAAPLASSRARQQATRNCWDLCREKHTLVTSQYVLDEASSGSVSLAAERLRLLSGIPLLPLSPAIDEVAADIVSRAILPQDAIIDALHIACAAFNRVDFLLTWNCKHIANPVILPRVFRVLDDFNLPFPVICTPQDMLQDAEDETKQ